MKKAEIFGYYNYQAFDILHTYEIKHIIFESLGGGHDDIYVTITIITMEPLQENDKVYVEMKLDQKSKSIIHSTPKRDITFIGLKTG